MKISNGLNFIKKIFRYLKLLKAFSIISLMDQMAYPANFWLAIITKTLRIAIILLFFKAVYLKVSNISGWGFGEALFIFATFSLIDFAVSVTFFRNFLFWFSKYLRNGFFDYRLAKPANLQFMTAFQAIDFMDLTTIVPTLLLYWYALNRMTAALSIANSALYFILLANAILFIYSFVLILATFNFWTIQSTGWGRFAAGILWMARYPTDIYSGVWKIAFNFIFPIAFIATWPAKAFLGILSWQNMIYALVFTVIFFWLANRFWNFGLKHYSSASS